MLIADSQAFRKAPPEKCTEQSAKPFLNLLATKWTDYDYATDIEVQREEAADVQTLEIARELLALNMSIENIMQVTKLSREEVDELQASV